MVVMGILAFINATDNGTTRLILLLLMLLAITLIITGCIIALFTLRKRLKSQNYPDPSQLNRRTWNVSSLDRPSTFRNIHTTRKRRSSNHHLWSLPRSTRVAYKCSYHQPQCWSSCRRLLRHRTGPCSGHGLPQRSLGPSLLSHLWATGRTYRSSPYSFRACTKSLALLPQFTTDCRHICCHDHTRCPRLPRRLHFTRPLEPYARHELLWACHQRRHRCGRRTGWFCLGSFRTIRLCSNRSALSRRGTLHAPGS